MAEAAGVKRYPFGVRRSRSLLMPLPCVFCLLISALFALRSWPFAVRLGGPVGSGPLSVVLSQNRFSSATGASSRGRFHLSFAHRISTGTPNVQLSHQCRRLLGNRFRLPQLSQTKISVSAFLRILLTG
jgi:hypothetical protein